LLLLDGTPLLLTSAELIGFCEEEDDDGFALLLEDDDDDEEAFCNALFRALVAS
jgi:hypothetical protein